MAVITASDSAEFRGWVIRKPSAMAKRVFPVGQRQAAKRRVSPALRDVEAESSRMGDRGRLLAETPLNRTQLASEIPRAMQRIDGPVRAKKRLGRRCDGCEDFAAFQVSISLPQRPAIFFLTITGRGKHVRHNLQFMQNHCFLPRFAT
jgi:hypothetical protein